MSRYRDTFGIKFSLAYFPYCSFSYDEKSDNAVEQGVLVEFSPFMSTVASVFESVLSVSFCEHSIIFRVKFVLVSYGNNEQSR